MKLIRIATRKSPLALYQSKLVAELLSARYPQMRTELVAMSTSGDRSLDVPLAEQGGKALFTKELEASLLAQESDIAVHSMKDVPAILPDGFTIAAITERANPKDALVSERYQSLESLPAGAVLGTSSLRRRCQIQAHHKDLLIKPVRGNVGTRIQKLQDGEFDALILACAGLERLGLGAYTALSTDSCLPAIGQGALGIECRSDDEEVIALLSPLNHTETATCVHSERLISAELGADCKMPLAAFAQLDGNAITLRAVLGDMQGTLLRASASGPDDSAQAIAMSVVKDLRWQGADAVLQKLASYV